MSKFKVGDLVKVTGNTNFHGFGIGEVVRIIGTDGVDYKCEHLDRHDWFWVIEKEMVLAYSNKSIHITTDGTTTTAVLKDGKNVVKRTEAKCSPSDEFDFNVVAKIAFDRLIGVEVKKREVKDYDYKMRCIDNIWNQTLYKVGEIYTVINGMMYDSKGTLIRKYKELKTFETFRRFTGSKFELITDTTPQVQEVKRKAKVGEWVKIVGARDWRLKDGEIYQVRDISDDYAFIEHKEGLRVPDGLLNIFENYVVLENYTPEEKTYTQAEVDALIEAELKRIYEEMKKVLFKNGRNVETTRKEN